MKDFTITITRDRLSDVLCSALEGGSNYWYWLEGKVEPTVWEFESDPPRERSHYLNDYPLNPGGALLIRDVEDEESHGTMCLDAQTIQWGLTILSQKYPQQIADILSEQDDANTGDILLQCALFGDIIYA